LPFNDDNIIVCHPTITPDGQSLYFAANFSDSRGGLDIYVSHYNKGQWSTPENLGDKINSINNENFPFYHHSGILYFASNRPQGLGGMDIYQAASADIDGQIVWEAATNLGEPYNSSKDDFGLITNFDKSSGYLSSNRSGGQGFDDIYYFENKENALADKNGTTLENNNGNKLDVNGDGKKMTKQGNICVLDDEIDERIKTAKVKIYEIHNGSSKKVIDIKTTDNNGSFSFAFKPNRSYIFEIQKEGYRQTEYNMNVGDLTGLETLDFCIPVQPANCQRVIGYAYEASSEIGLPNTVVAYVNECTGEIQTAKTDGEGRFEMCLPCGCQHSFKVSKQGYKTRSQQYLPIDENCSKVSVLNFWLYKGQGNYLIEGDDVVLHTGQVLTLRRIFYDFDKSNIRQDATADLNDLAALMLEYPSIEIELSSHTDSRGDNNYNYNLSQKRADEAQKYLIAKGISPNKISAIGYGETRLLNRCADGRNCSENEHQLNRRTEVKIIRFDEQGIDIKILDNLPD
jgi:outer membrane protein OmpA-like peptidoglycan-associated protein